MEVGVGRNGLMRQPFPPQTDGKNRGIVSVSHLHSTVQYRHGAGVLYIGDDAKPAGLLEVSDIRAQFLQVLVLWNPFRVDHA